MSTAGEEIEIKFYHNSDGKPLTSAYNHALMTNEGDYFLFMHDDIEFLKPNWATELLRLFKDNPSYGIIGVAGSSEYKSMAEKEHGAWWRYKNIYGQVLHRHEGKTWLTTFSPLLKKDLQEVVVIDGLFIAVDKRKITKMFDEDFTFDHYDTSFCISNFLDGKAKIGVTTNIRIAHNSIGQMRPNWEEALVKLNDKYGNKFPLRVQ